MTGKSLNRYVWMLNEFLQKGALTYEKISQNWEQCSWGDHKPLPLRTFHQHRKAIEELFGIEIVCTSQSGYKYTIKDAKILYDNRMNRWLVNSFSVENMIAAGRNMSGRILFENIPHGTEYLQDIIEAMQAGKALMVDYQAFGHSRAMYHIQPYALKIFNGRWYLLGFIEESEAVRQLSLDRFLSMEQSDQTFEMPDDFNAEKYYQNTVGIFVNENLVPQTVRIRVYGRTVNYLRYLPLHRTQREVLTKNEMYSDFEYRVCLTPELSSKLLAMGENVEVLEPKGLRDDIKKRLEEALERYK